MKKILLALVALPLLLAQNDGRLNGLQQAVTLPLDGGQYNAVGIQIAGTFSATVAFEGSVDCATYVAINATPLAGGSAVTSATAAGQWVASPAGLCRMRARISSYTSGTAVLSLLPTSGGGPLLDASGNLTIGSTILDPTNGIKGPIIACVAAPGNTAGPYGSLCEVRATGALWACANAAGCTVSGDWAAAGGGGSMVYPSAGIPQSSGASWGSSLALDTDTALTANSDTRLPSQKAVKAYADTKAASNASTTVNGQTCALGSTCTVTASAVAFTTLTDASPLAWDIASAASANRTVTLDHATATRALNVSNLANGGTYTLKVIQDATGGAGLTLGTGCTWIVGNGGGGAVVPTVAANAVDLLTFTYDGTYCLASYIPNLN